MSRNYRSPARGSLIKSLLVLVVTSSLYDVMLARPESKDGMRMDSWRLSRRSYCVKSAGKCFSTGQCCDGLVCAAFDDYFGQKPEVPGYCVKEKDLQSCAGNGDCESGSRCMSLGRTGERYCLPKSEIRNLIAEQQRLEVLAAVEQKENEANLKGLGADCETSADCKSTTEYSNNHLCCQDVPRGRQGVRRICDRVTGRSTCIP